MRRWIVGSLLMVAIWMGSAPAAVAQKSEAADRDAATSETAAGTTSLLQNLNFGGLWSDNSLTNWLILLAGIFLGLLVGKILATVLSRVAGRLEARGWKGRAEVFSDLVSPAKLAVLAVGLSVGVSGVVMSDGLRVFSAKTLLLLFSISVYWYAYNLVSLIEVWLERLTAKTDSTLDDQLVPLVRKTLRIFLTVVAVLFVVDSVFEKDIGAWLAGLGIAGLAVSLAAQDSLKNLFGSLTILLDQPFQVGQRITFGGYDGIVEEIGFRSTKIRTLNGHVVTIPNSNIVNDPVENIALRPTIKRVLNVTITYDTPREKIEQAVEILRGILDEEGIREPIHPVIDGNEYPPRVYFNDYNAESLNILVIYWYAPPAYWDYLEHAQCFNLRMFEEYERAGIEFAFPTQTVFLAGDPNRELEVKMIGGETHG